MKKCIAILLSASIMMINLSGVAMAGSNVCHHTNGYQREFLKGHYNTTHQVLRQESVGYETCYVSTDVIDICFVCPDCSYIKSVDTLYISKHSLSH